MTSPLPTIAAVLFITFAAAATAAPVIVTITSSKGKSMTVRLMGKQGDKYLIRRTSDGKEFAIPPGILDEASQKLLMEKAKTMKEIYPPLEADVSIGKRRKPRGSSSYMKAMEITGKVTLTNGDNSVPCPPCSARLIFIGQNQKYESRYKVLSSQQFDITPTDKGEDFTTLPFVTVYDSDNKGDGNSGGYKYYGYLLVVQDRDDNVILTKTLSGRISKAMEMNVSLAKNMLAYKEGQILDESMEKRSRSSR